MINLQSCCAWLMGVILLVLCSTPLFAKTDIHVALIDSFTKYESGEEFGWGLDTTYGAALAFDQINAKSDLYEFKYKIFRSGSRPAETIEAVSLAVKEGYKIVIGLNWSTHLLMVADILNKNNVLMFSPTASASSLPTKINHFVSIMADNSNLANMLARVTVNHIHLSNVLIVKVLNDEYSLDLAKLFESSYVDMGGEGCKRIWNSSK